MRIIDKNTDFYDYLQNVYRDDSVTFDRTDSFLLSKDMICENLYFHGRSSGFYSERGNCLHKKYYVLIQICNTFWLFCVEVTEIDRRDFAEKPASYSAELVATWKNYSKPRRLIQCDLISFSFTVKFALDKRTEEDKVNILTQAIDTNGYRSDASFNKRTVSQGDGRKIEKHIPLLKASGFAPLMNPQDVYLSLEEYFSAEKQSQERTESVGITDKEKIENHGFDTKTSFRGKQ